MLTFVQCLALPLHFCYKINQLSGALSVHFSRLLRSLQIAAQPSAVAATPPNFVLSANVLRRYSAPSFRSLMKMLNLGLFKNLPGTSPVTGLQLGFVLLINTLWFWPFNESVNLTVCSSYISFSMRILWETPSKALLKSRLTIPLLHPSLGSQSTQHTSLSRSRRTSPC